MPPRVIRRHCYIKNNNNNLKMYYSFVEKT